jgi:hypothetical protein
MEIGNGVLEFEASDIGQEIGLSDGQSAELMNELIDESWGEPWTHKIKHGHYECQNSECRWSLTKEPEKMFKSIIGFTTKCPPRVEEYTSPAGKVNHRTPAVGGMIYECPKCGEHFWNHAERDYLPLYRRRCPLWPKMK